MGKGKGTINLQQSNENVHQGKIHAQSMHNTILERMAGGNFIFMWTGDIKDPEHPYSLEQLNVLSEESITVDEKLGRIFLDAIYPSNNIYNKKMLIPTQRLVTLAILNQTYSSEQSSSNPFIPFLINKEDLGTISLGILYSSFTVFSLVAALVVRFLGSKNALILGTTEYWLFIAVNLIPTW
ncbi:UNC93-like protein 3 [Camellia lanceoleosa]|uniref:UNC93-like protein 3 n=1 Tax=Camellia lanceoleosa TaxID=1840588 RepID=A0ACC0FCR3_9ERIC|nr:UNC93-like protein 3 [Camellia lanceoleosa]